MNEPVHNPIRSVKHFGTCDCGQARVLITFENGATVACHDDGSFVAWTGGLGEQAS